MLLIIFLWIITILVFLSFGFILISVWNKILKTEDEFSFFDTFWIGMCTVGILLMLISLVSPISIYVNVVLLAIPALYWFLNYKKGIKVLKLYKSRLLGLPWYLIMLLISLAFIIAACNLKNLATYDSGLYYFQTLMWNEQYSVVPGLGNLHSRFGFNSNFLLLSTLFYHPSTFITVFPLNSLFVFIVLSWLVICLFKTKKIGYQIVIFLTIYIAFRAYFDMLSSLSTDIAPNFIIIYILLSCIDNPKYLLERRLLLCMLSVFSITFKLSLALICIIPLVILFLTLKRKEYQYCIALVVIMAFIIVPWCTRFVILTGYLIYPFPSIDLFSFDWKMPQRLVELEKTIVYAWARVPSVPIEESLRTPIDKKWFLDHISWMHASTKLSYLLILLSPVFILLYFKQWKHNWFILSAWGIAFCGVLMNFFTGPDPRFSQGFIIIAALSPLLYFSFKELNLSVIPVVWTVAFISLFTLYGSLVKKYVIDEKSDFTPLYTLFYKPEPVIFDKAKDDTDFYEYIIDGVVIYSPNTIGEDPEICYDHCNNRCFDHKLPCTPYLNNNLELRGKSLQEGFRIKE